MVSRVLAVITLLSCLWLAQSALVSLRSNPGAQVKAAQTTAITFPHTSGTPDPNALLKLVNQTRQAQGLPSLSASQPLTAVAQTRANDMVSRHYYAHQSPTGTYYYDLLKDKGINASYSCENLDLAFTLDVDTYLSDWLASPNGHSECLLNPDVSGAGYAAAPFMEIPFNGAPTMSYVVVAIHATQLETRK